MDTGITIIRATAADAEIIAVLNKQLIEDEKHENKMTVAELTVRMRGWITADYAAFLFQQKDQTVGYALIGIKEEPYYLRQFFIVRDRRRHGVGTQAFHALLEFLKLESLDLDVLAWNTRAAAFWKSLGFQERSIRMQYRKIKTES